MMRLLETFVQENPEIGFAASLIVHLYPEAFAEAFSDILAVTLSTEAISTTGLLMACMFAFILTTRFLDGLDYTRDASPTGVRSWDECPNPNSTIFCPKCGYNVDATAEQHANLCSECQYGSVRTNAWNIPDVAADAEEYGELREDYVRGEMRLDEFQREVEVEETDVLSSYD